MYNEKWIMYVNQGVVILDFWNIGMAAELGASSLALSRKGHGMLCDVQSVLCFFKGENITHVDVKKCDLRIKGAEIMNLSYEGGAILNGCLQNVIVILRSGAPLWMTFSICSNSILRNVKTLRVECKKVWFENERSRDYESGLKEGGGE